MLKVRVPYPVDVDRLLHKAGKRDYPALLHSALRGNENGRYSYFAAYPFLVLEGRAAGSTCTYLDPDGRMVAQQFMEGDCLDHLSETYARFNVLQDPGQALPGGAMGYFAYDLFRQLGIYRDLPAGPGDNKDVPLLSFAFYDCVLSMDHVAEEAWITCVTDALELPWFPARGKERLARFGELIGEAGSMPGFELDPAALAAAPFPPTREMGREAYLEKVREILRQIRDGEIFQACFTYERTCPFESDPALLYSILAASNPSPFSAYLGTPGFSVVSASPERFLKKEAGGGLETRPIKGTRRRGKTREEDEALRKELETSIKDQAENLMITDLLRNDLGKVSRLGTVRVEKLLAIEEYRNVFQLVSIIRGEGKLPGRRRSLDYFSALFPGGSMTGAPKKRALEILSLLEENTRGVYSGHVGYLSFNDNFDLNIVIRSALIKDGLAYVGTGSGIVYDSDPMEEYEETRHKVDFILRAIGLANSASARAGKVSLESGLTAA